MEPAERRYRLWTARRCAVTLVIALAIFGGGTIALGSRIQLHPVGPAEREAGSLILRPSGRRDWVAVAGQPLLAQWDADADGRPDQLLPLQSTTDGWRLPEDAELPADAQLRLRYPPVDLWTLLGTELRP